MKLGASELHDRFRQPEYTGTNRCVPCTVLNAGIAGLGALALAFVSPPVGVVAFVAAVLVIYFRGYLIPGTPELTNRYLPDRVLLWFHDDPHPTSFDTPDPSESDPEPVEILNDAEIIEASAGEDDVRLTADFREEWHEKLNDTDDGLTAPNIADALGLDPDNVSVEPDGTVYVDASSIQRIEWGSPAAVTADVAAAQLVDERYDDWDDLSPTTKHTFMRGLRYFLDQCPACQSEDVTLGTRAINPGCCGDFNVTIYGCNDCDAKLLDMGDEKLAEI